MSKHKITMFIALALCAAPDLTAEQYMKLKSGSKYLGRVSAADQKKFIFCDAKVASIPDGAQLEDTLETCGKVWTMEVPTYRLLTISEGAAASHNSALAKDALDAAIKIQDKNKPMTDLDVKLSVDKIESKAGGKLQDYLDKGKLTLPNDKTVRP